MSDDDAIRKLLKLDTPAHEVLADVLRREGIAAWNRPRNSRIVVDVDGRYRAVPGHWDNEAGQWVDDEPQEEA